MKRWRRRLVTATVAMVLLGAALLALAALRGRPGDLPWVRLDLGDSIGWFTGRKLAALHGDFPQCRALLDRAGVRYSALPPRAEGSCGYQDAVRFAPGGSRTLRFAPASVGIACPVAAALAKWEWDVVQPAAWHRLGARVVAIEHFGSYNCRRFYGRPSGDWSEHAHANALDVAAFRLADGTRVAVVKDWTGGGAKAAFLRDVRDGACRLFATVLSPDYNPAHRDHLHLDQAPRGALGWRACR